MKKLLSHASVRRQLEFLNLLIGIVLIAISLVYLLNGEPDFFASWFVFGCMYMVMDKYWPSDHYSELRIKADVVKYVINIAALAVSVWFLLSIVW